MFYIRTLYKAKGNDMYIPKANLTTDQDEIVAFMKEYCFAMFITSGENIPVASHLPFTISRRDSQLILVKKLLPVLVNARNNILNLLYSWPKNREYLIVKH